MLVFVVVIDLAADGGLAAAGHAAVLVAGAEEPDLFFPGRVSVGGEHGAGGTPRCLNTYVVMLHFALGIITWFQSLLPK
ncbi:hypothetical protein D7W82_22565 [Corallococcus sp. CA049B]|nr:hypothetical protein D7W82_22565 [Corallococcus sp. CA049B]